MPVEAAVVAATSGAKGAAIGGLVGTLTGDASSLVNLNPKAMAQNFSGGPLILARNFGVTVGVYAGISCVIKRLRGKEDLQSTVAVAFGSGALYSLISGMGRPNQAVNAVTQGMLIALVQGKIFQLSQSSAEEDVQYVKIKTLLSNLGLQNYENNFKKGLLTDNTLPLLNDCDLRDVEIPPGPRLLFLDHIERDPELKEKRRAHRQSPATGPTLS